MKVLFNAFSFLQKKLENNNIPYSNHVVSVNDGTTAEDLIRKLGLSPDEIEGAFINGRIGSLDTILSDGDRIAVFPPGTPGPYRLLLGIKQSTKG